MKQANNLHDLEIPVLLPGLKINTSPTNHHPVRAMQLGKFDGTTLGRPSATWSPAPVTDRRLSRR